MTNSPLFVEVRSAFEEFVIPCEWRLTNSIGYQCLCRKTAEQTESTAIETHDSDWIQLFLQTLLPRIVAFTTIMSMNNSHSLIHASSYKCTLSCNQSCSSSQTHLWFTSNSNWKVTTCTKPGLQTTLTSLPFTHKNTTKVPLTNIPGMSRTN